MPTFLYRNRILTKADVDQHADGPGWRSQPAVNVKVYHFPLPEVVVDRFGCSEETAEQALNYAFEQAQRTFWAETAPELAAERLAPRFGKVQVYSAGRSDGWLEVHGLPPVQDWDGADLAVWRGFAYAVEREVHWLCSAESVLEDIEANDWHKAGALAYNWIDLTDGGAAAFTDNDPPCRCENCGRRERQSELKPIKDLMQRVSPGEVMPAGECSACGALSHLIHPILE